MNKTLTSRFDDPDCRMCMVVTAGVYSPLLLILSAALILF